MTHSPVQPRAAIVVALSGGLDSTVLLHWLIQHYPLKQLRVIHINHQLQTCADAMAVHCQDYCVSFGLSCEIKTITEQPAVGDSIEAWARAQRYTLLTRSMQAHDVLVTAHHADDQAETVLLNLFRGAGVAGLAAMLEVKSLSVGRQWRPLLACSRAELQAYAAAHGLNWFDDPSNTDQRFDRNYIRQHILPAITMRWPAIVHNLNATAGHCQQALAIEQVWAQAHLQTMMHDNTLQLAMLPSDPAQRTALLRAFLQAQSAPLPSQQQLNTIVTTVIGAKAHANPLCKLGGGELRRYRDTLYWFAQPIITDIEDYEIAWDGQSNVMVPGFGEVTSQHLQELGLSELPQELYLRSRRGGEQCRPIGWSHAKPLKDCYQAFAIPPWRRACLPLLFVGDRLIAVIGGWACQ